MNINSYGAYNTPINYANSKHSKSSSNSSNATFGQMPQETHVPSGNITIHGIYGNTDEAGNKTIGGWGDAIAGTSSTVYKPADFDPANPEYLMKIWDSNNELLEERRVNIGDVNPRSSDAFDMYAYSCHLSDSGEFPGAMERFMMISAGNKSGKLEYSISDMLEKTDWVGVLKSFMDTQYKLGNMKGYMDYKSFYDFLGAQKSTSINSTTPKVIDGVVFENRSYAMSLTYEEALAKKEFSNAGRDEFLGRVFRNFDNFAKNAPDDVKKAWAEAADEIGVDGFGIGRNGMMGHISQLLVLQVERGYRGEGNSEDLLGSSVDSALSIARQALQRLDYPLEPHSNRPPEAQEGIKKEREFYLAFISKLEAIQERDKIKTSALNKDPDHMGVNKNNETAENEKSEEKDLWLLLHEHIDEMREKLKNGEVQDTIPIGAQTFTIEEWDKLMEKFDKIEEQITQAMREDIEKRKAIREAEKGNYITQDDAVNIIVTDSLKCRYEQINPDKEEPLYITAFDSTGIKCVKEGSESFEWIIEFKNEEDYAKVAEFVNSLPEHSNYRFAPNKNFWEDMISGNIDKQGFMDFIKGTDDGKPDYLIQTEDGTYIDKEKAKYAQYMNNPGFFTVLTLDEVNQRLRDGYYSSSDDNNNIVPAESKTDSYEALNIPDVFSREVKPKEALREPPKAPYEHLAKDGVINYKGATFILDTENNSINLGDVSIEAKKAGKVISVPLEDGGTFNFNVDNMDQLGKAIDMFSPEDINRIMRAIHQYKMAQSKKKELDDIKSTIQVS